LLAPNPRGNERILAKGDDIGECYDGARAAERHLIAVYCYHLNVAGSIKEIRNLRK